jgi:hypothetical protein
VLFRLKVKPMDVYETIECILDANNGEVTGRTAVQKLVYLSKCVISELEIPPYKPHYYGPYSSAVSIALEKLVSYSFIDERRVPAYLYESYVYSLTGDGKKMMRLTRKQHQSTYKKIKNVVDTCREFCDLKPKPLSYASKVFFTLERLPKDQRKQELDNAVENAKRLGWDISPHDVKVGKQLLDNLKLV